MASRRRTEEERLDHQKKYGHLGPTKTRDHLPFLHPSRSETRPDIAAAIASGTMTAACGLWCLGSIIGFVVSKQNHPLPPGQSWNLQLILDTVPLDRWAVNFAVSIVSTAFLIVQTLCLWFYICMENRSRKTKDAEAEATVVSTEELEMDQLEARKENADKQLRKNETKLEKEKQKYEDKTTAIQKRIETINESSAKGSAKGSVKGSSARAASRQGSHKSTKPKAPSKPASKAVSTRTPSVPKSTGGTSPTRASRRRGLSNASKVEISSVWSRGRSKSVTKEDPVKNVTKEVKPDESIRSLSVDVPRGRETTPEPIDQEQNEEQPVHPLVQESGKTDGNGSARSNRSEVAEPETQEDKPIPKIPRERLDQKLPPIPRTTEGDDEPKSDAVAHKSTLLPDEVVEVLHQAKPTDTLPDGVVELSQQAKSTNTLPDENTNSTLLPLFTIPRKPLQSRAKPPPLPRSTVKRKPLPENYIPIQPSSKHPDDPRQVQSEPEPELQPEPEPKPERKPAFFSTLFNFRSTRPKSSTQSEPPNARSDKSHKPDKYNRPTKSDRSIYLPITKHARSIRLSQLSFATEPFNPPMWELAQRMRDNQPPYRDDPNNPYVIEPYQPRPDEMPPPRQSPVLSLSENASIETTEDYFRAQNTQSRPPSRRCSSRPSSKGKERQSPSRPDTPADELFMFDDLGRSWKEI